MTRRPAFAAAFNGRWRIVEMDMFGDADLDLDGPAHITFAAAGDGEMAFCAVRGALDVRYGARDGSACAEFTWQVFDEGDEVCGRGWAARGTAGRLVGHIFIHNGDDSGFVAERG
jgi:hypothetical protein